MRGLVLPAQDGLGFDGLGVFAIVPERAELLFLRVERDGTFEAGGREGREEGGAVSRGCLVFRHWEVVDTERAAVRGLRSAPLAQSGFGLPRRTPRF